MIIEQDVYIEHFLDRDVYVEHFGTKGMRWGVRKSPSEVAAKREAKAQKYVKRADKLQAEINKMQTDNQFYYSPRLQKLREQKEVAEQDVERKRQGKLSRGQKRVVVGASVATAILAAYGTYQALNSGNARRLIAKGKLHVTKTPGVPWKVDHSLSDPNLDADGIMSKVVKHINPGYGKSGTKMNCRRATYAYEMRRRGYDVAATRSTNGRGQDISGQFNVLNPGVNLVPPGRSGIFTRIIGEARKARKSGAEKPFTEEIMKASKSPFGKLKVDPTRIHEALSLQPDGARGELGMRWRGGGGHSMAWEKIKGQIVVFDTQTGKKYSTPDELHKLGIHLSAAGVTRLDDLPLNNDFLMRWLKDA